MTDKEVIKKIQELKQIQPRKDWVVLTKGQILGDYRESLSAIKVLRMVFHYKPVLTGIAAVLSVLIVVGVFTVSQNSVPGEPLHSLEKVSEATKENFISEQQKPEFYLGLAEKRIEELKEVARNNKAKNLSSAIKETTESIKKASESIPLVAQKPEQTAKLINKVASIKKGTDDVGKTLGIAVGKKEVAQLEKKVLACITTSMKNTESEMTRTMAETAKREIEYWKSRTLSEDKQKVLEEAEGLYKKGDYSQVLELLLNSQKYDKSGCGKSGRRPD